MGTVIKAKRNGYRRAGLVHQVAGTFHAEGDLSEAQLQILRVDPHLVVVEGVQEDALQVGADSSERLHEMGATIAGLEQDLEGERACLDIALSTLTAVRDHQVKVPNLVLDAIRLLDPAPVDGVITINEAALVEIIDKCLKEASSDASQSALENSGGDDASSTSASVSPVAAPPGADTPVKVEKPTAKRGGEKKGAGE